MASNNQKRKMEEQWEESPYCKEFDQVKQETAGAAGSFMEALIRMLSISLYSKFHAKSFVIFRTLSVSSLLSFIHPKLFF